MYLHYVDIALVFKALSQYHLWFPGLNRAIAKGEGQKAMRKSWGIHSFCGVKRSEMGVFRYCQDLNAENNFIYLRNFCGEYFVFRRITGIFTAYYAEIRHVYSPKSGLAKLQLGP